VPRAGDAGAELDASGDDKTGGCGSPVAASSANAAAPARATADAKAGYGIRSPPPDSVAPVGPAVHFFFGMDKGRRSRTVKVYLGILNQHRPASVVKSVFIGVFPCRTNDCTALRRIRALCLADIEELRSSGLLVGGALRSFLLILAGDYASISAFRGHTGTSIRHPCLLCSAFGPLWEEAQLVGFYYCIQHGSQCLGEPLTVEKAAMVFHDWSACSENASLPRSLTHNQHRSIQRRPLMLVPPSDIAPMTLHKTLSITTDMLHLAAQMFQASSGPVRATKHCEDLGDLLIERAGVNPAPYFGGIVEESKCHRIGRKQTLVCNFLDEYALPQWAVRYRRACDDWKALLPTLNRTETISAHDADGFERRTVSFVDGLRASFYCFSVTSKMHVLVCHCAAFL